MMRAGLIDLAAARVGGRALVASDEFFASRHNLLAAGPALFIEGKYTDRGKWVGGWGTRRPRGPGGGCGWGTLPPRPPGAAHPGRGGTPPFQVNHPPARCPGPAP